MRKKILFLAGMMACCSLAGAQEISKTWVADKGNGTYQNPVLHADYSDPDVCAAGDDFYMTASSFNCIPGIPILHSNDLVNWSLVNYALPIQEPEEFFDKAQHGKGVWAPAIRFHNGEFYIYWGDPDYGIYMIKAKDPKGRWSKPVLVKAGKVNKAFIGIENNKPDAIQLMTKVASSYAGIEVVPLKVKYPQGGEKQLIDAITKRQVASGALPISTGAVVQNVGTAFAVYEAVQKNKPLFERVITVTGKSVARPSNFLARIGTPMKQLIDACGGLPEDTGKVIGGGPMMGKALVNIDVPTAKGSSGILIMNRKEAKRGEAQTCIRCAKCVSACPMGLEPYLLGALSENGDFETMEKERIMDCIECGSCQFTCPANRPLLDYCRLGKGKVGAMIRARQAKK